MIRQDVLQASRLALLLAAVSVPGPLAANPAADPDARARALFRRPLIIGASISSGYRAEDPATKLARRFGSSGNVVSLAVAGATGSSLLPALTDDRLAAATVVIGVDLFFWDTIRNCAVGVAGVEGLFRRLSRHRTPVILGNIPAVSGRWTLGGSGRCRDQVNAAIARACAADPSCILIDMIGLLDEHRLALGQILTGDGHLTDAGSELVSRAILDAVRRSPAPAD